MQTPQPRYEQIITISFIVTIGLAISFLIESSAVNPRFAFGGDLPEVSLSWLLVRDQRKKLKTFSRIQLIGFWTGFVISGIIFIWGLVYLTVKAILRF